MTNSWNGTAAPRLLLGTAQLGMPYGIANESGAPGGAAAQAIVAAAVAHGIRHFDTAQAYGDSERVLGGALRAAGGAGVSVATKLAATLDPLDAAQVRESVQRSLDRLQIDRLWCLMLHDPSWLAVWDRGLGDTLREERAQGRVEHLGVSLRTPADAPAAFACGDIAIVQAPCNAWDRRLAEQGLLAGARRLGKLCCIRSVYLQGLLTLAPHEVSHKLPRAAAASKRWWALAHELGMTAKALAVRYALSLDAPLVVGAESVDQIEETMSFVPLGPLPREAVAAIARAIDPLVDEYVIEPYRWGR